MAERRCFNPVPALHNRASKLSATIRSQSIETMIVYVGRDHIKQPFVSVVNQLGRGAFQLRVDLYVNRHRG